MIPDMELDPDADRWDLPIVGFRVYDIWFSGRLYVIAYGENSGLTLADFPKVPLRTQIAFGGPFVLSLPDGAEHYLDAAEPWETLVTVLGLRGACIASAQTDRGGILRIHFENGSSLVAGPHPQYENWEVAGPGALYLVVPPGGGDPRVAS